MDIALSMKTLTQVVHVALMNTFQSVPGSVSTTVTIDRVLLIVLADRRSFCNILQSVSSRLQNRNIRETK